MSKYVKADMIGCPCGYCEGYDECQKEVEEAPSIDICFCKECKNKGTEDCPMKEWNYTWGEYEYFNADDDFCSYGERIEQ